MKLAKQARQTFQLASASFCLHLPGAEVLNFYYSGDYLLLSMLGIELIFSCKAGDLQFVLPPQQSLILSGNITKKKTVASFTTTGTMFHHTVSTIWREKTVIAYIEAIPSTCIRVLASDMTHTELTIIYFTCC